MFLKYWGKKETKNYQPESERFSTKYCCFYKWVFAYITDISWSESKRLLSNKSNTTHSQFQMDPSLSNGVKIYGSIDYPHQWFSKEFQHWCIASSWELRRILIFPGKLIEFKIFFMDFLLRLFALIASFHFFSVCCLPEISRIKSTPFFNYLYHDNCYPPVFLYCFLLNQILCLVFNWLELSGIQWTLKTILWENLTSMLCWIAAKMFDRTYVTIWLVLLNGCVFV